ncbi:hypothetical protein [Longispora albida]|uniref:hypothetical protein n=1 Tax=Longispora albida TaxID=203523 RepID=UPI00035FD383|nr:hypothetical protein [Longispora albida]
MRSNVRRVLAGLGIAAAMVAGVTAPATAAPAAEVAATFHDLVVASGGAGKMAAVTVRSAEEVELPKGYTVKIDLSGIAGIATFELPKYRTECKAEGTTVICEWPYPTTIGKYPYGFGVGTITAAEQAKPGAVGTVKTTFSSSATPDKATTSKVTVGQAVNLVAGPGTRVDAKPGDTVKAPWGVRNSGKTAVDGVVLLTRIDPVIAPAQRYSNCSYSDAPGENVAVCTFSTVLAGGREYQLGQPTEYKLPADMEAPGGSWGMVTWMTPADWQVEQSTWMRELKFTPGTGGKLELVEKQAQTHAVPQTDENDADNWSWLSIRLTGKNPVDLAGIGATATGKAGDVVRVKVGVKNNGPAVRDWSGAAFGFRVTAPAGATFTEVPKRCYYKDGDRYVNKPGGKVYDCYSQLDRIAVGGEEFAEFALRIDQVTDNATGSIRAYPYFFDNENMQVDGNPANDEAKIVLNPKAAPAPPANNPGELPVTGAAAIGIATGGAALLGLGVFGFVLARRRRIRFVADNR